jgi:hypothetical protein
MHGGDQIRSQKERLQFRTEPPSKGTWRPWALGLLVATLGRGGGMCLPGWALAPLAGVARRRRQPREGRGKQQGRQGRASRAGGGTRLHGAGREAKLQGAWEVGQGRCVAAGSREGSAS